MTMSTVDHRSPISVEHLRIDMPKQPATVVNLDTTPLVETFGELIGALHSLTQQVDKNCAAIVSAIGNVKPPSVVVEPTIQVSPPNINLPEPTVIIQRVDGQIVTQKLLVNKMHLLLLVLPYAYIAYEIIRKLV